MKFPKPIRVKRKLQKFPYCFICGHPATFHHLRTKGAGGGDEPENLMALCLMHHREAHDKGAKTFANKYSLPISFESGYPRRTDIK